MARTAIARAISLLFRNPELFLKKVRSRIEPLPRSPVQRSLAGVLFEFDFGLDPHVKDLYFGIYEPATVIAMGRQLKNGDTFIDVGANIGYLSALGAGLVGRTGQVHSFEPVPRYYDRLRRMALANREYTIFPNQCALSDTEATANIAVTNLPNIGWNTMVAGFMSREATQEIVEVQTCRLDTYLDAKGLERISLIKIDAEGSEFPVLRGLSGYLEKTKHRPPIICEIAPHAYPYLGCTLDELVDYMSRWNYRALSLVDPCLAVDIRTLRVTTDVLFMSC